MWIRDSAGALPAAMNFLEERTVGPELGQDSIDAGRKAAMVGYGLVVVYMIAVSYTHLRAHDTVLDLVCRLLLEKQNSILDCLFFILISFSYIFPNLPLSTHHVIHTLKFIYYILIIYVHFLTLLRCL